MEILPADRCGAAISSNVLDAIVAANGTGARGAAAICKRLDLIPGAG